MPRPEHCLGAASSVIETHRGIGNRGHPRRGAILTAEFIAFHAAERPDAIAFLIDGREFRYATLARDAARFAAALKALGVSAGQLVAVGVDDFYLHWTLTIALDRLGAGTASFQEHEGESCEPMISRADLCVTDPQYSLRSARRHHRLTPEWLQEVWMAPSVEAPRRPRLSADDPVRILRTSGTTGLIKMLLLRRRTSEARIESYAAQEQFTEASRYFIAVAPNVGRVFGAVMACLRAGGTLVMEHPKRMSVAEAIVAHGITHVTLMPVQLKMLLDMLPADFRKPAHLTVGTFGAPVSAALRERALARLATNVYNNYGCNEVGIISVTRFGDDAVGGVVAPGARVEIVDERGEPVPEGGVGGIRVRTECMAEGYLDDPEATRRMFRDGWFYPGDSGMLQGARRLRVLGRTDDLLNAGGLKHAPDHLEILVAKEIPVRDVGICSVPGAEGLEDVYVAIVADDIGDRELEARVKKALQFLLLGNVRIFRPKSIPRNEAGKIQRDRLRSLVESALRRRQ